MIKDIVLDFGGVLTTIDTDRALARFNELGLETPGEYINSYCQKGPFFALENGDITADEFCTELGGLCRRKISYDDAKFAWCGFITDVRVELLEFLQGLRGEYRLSVLSNTNPFIQGWARSPLFTTCGKSLDDYFDMLFLSYCMKCSKPGEAIYRKMIADGSMIADETLFIDDSDRNLEAAARVGIRTLKVENGEDWRDKLLEYLAVK
ncbi:MAG: HAD family phosphatase [Bacteroidaceae bacterium]|nr:HAD family phosphatase [Bacteroidaceae bacterium]